MKKSVIDQKVKFIKQAPVRARYRLRRKTKKEIDFTVDSIKQVPVHPRYRLKRADKKSQISRENVSKLMRVEFDFNPKKILNKH